MGGGGVRDSWREVKIVKGVEQTQRCKPGKCAAVEEEEEVMTERLLTACLYLFRCVQSVDSLEVRQKPKHKGNN